MDLDVPDRLRLPFTFEPARLLRDLASLEASSWIDHFVTSNYEGRWTVIPLRAPLGTEDAHPILQISSHPSEGDFVDTTVLDGCTYFAHVLAALGFPLGAARLMRLDPGSVIRTHVDADLSFDQGWVRLHVPVTTNPDVEFLVNGEPVTMREGECWYLRLSDPHSVRNGGTLPRVHIVIDAPAGPELAAVFERALSGSRGPG
jgi:hypothetical protein